MIISFTHNFHKNTVVTHTCDTYKLCFLSFSLLHFSEILGIIVELDEKLNCPFVGEQCLWMQCVDLMLGARLKKWDKIFQPSATLRNDPCLAGWTLSPHPRQHDLWELTYRCSRVLISVAGYFLHAFLLLFIEVHSQLSFWAKIED